MPEQNERKSFMVSFTTIGKDLIAMLRDGFLLLIAILLLFWPATINNILVEAGFEEGSFAGLKWKKKLTESDETLLKAQSTISDLQVQIERLSSALKEATAGSPETEANTDLERINQQLISSSTALKNEVASRTANNAKFVQRFQESAGQTVTWGVVFGADRSLDEAQYETGRIASNLELINSTIYFRQGFYRAVAITTDREEAEQLLQKAKMRRKDAYIVNIDTWCPEARKENGYYKCQ